MYDTSIHRENYILPQNETLVFHSMTDALPGHETLVGTIPIPGYYQLWEDRYPPKGVSGGRTNWNSFEHYKCVVDPGSGGGGESLCGRFGNAYNGFGSYLAKTSNPLALYYGVFGAPGRLNTGLSEYYALRQDGGFVPPPSDLDKLINASLREMLPRVQADLSILNALFELRDFKSLPRTIANIYSLGAKFFRTGRSTLRAILQGSADGYLQAKFNILPLLSDISGLTAALKRSDSQISGFISRAGKPQKRHFRRLLVDTDGQYSEATEGGVVPLYEENQHYAFGSSLKRYVYPLPTIFHAEIEYNYNYTRYQLEHAQVLAFLDSIGVNLNPSIIWNAIPWTFVVDWVVGIGRWLDSMRVGNMDPQINIHRYLWSVKRARRIIVTRETSFRTYEEFGDGAKQSSGPVPLPVVHETSYRRQVESLPASSLLVSGLTAEEVSLGAALVTTRRWRKTKPPAWK